MIAEALYSKFVFIKSNLTYFIVIGIFIKKLQKVSNSMLLQIMSKLGIMKGYDMVVPFQIRVPH